MLDFKYIDISSMYIGVWQKYAYDNIGYNKLYWISKIRCVELVGKSTDFSNSCCKVSFLTNNIISLQIKTL